MARNLVIAVRRASRHDARRVVFPSNTWEFLRHLGQTFGWQPRGTTYVTSPRQKTPAPIPTRHNYQAGGVQDYKRIDAQDAAEWASALGVARHSPYFSGMIRAQAGAAGCSEEPLLSVVDDFIEFAQEGEFAFALSAEADDPVSLSQASSEA